jgi:DNA-binding LacI/PurR family transcriptional regulator
MDDVARESGFSRATVSMALKGERAISAQTQQTVQEVAKRLGYRVNPLVSALMSLQRRRRGLSVRSTTAIAYLSSHTAADPQRRHPTYVKMMAGAVRRAGELGCNLQEFNLAAPGMTPARLREILLTRHIHAIVAAPLPHRTTSLDFDFTQFAVVGLGMSVAHPIIERVANDHFQSAALAVRHCRELGYRRPGLVLSQETSHRLAHRWLGGYRLAMAQDFPQVRPILLMTERTHDLASAVPGWERKEKPDVVIYGNSEPALVRAIRAHRVNLAVESTDDRCTGIFQNYEMLGAVAVEHALARLQTNSFGPLACAQLHLVEGIWVAGTTAPGPAPAKPAASPTALLDVLRQGAMRR